MSRCPRLLFAAVFLAVLPGARADVSEHWFRIAVETLRSAHESAEAADRRLAIVGQAIAQALAVTMSCGGNGDGNSAALRERREAAVAVAAFAVLEALYPEQREGLESQLALAFSYIPETPAKADGGALGRRIAHEVLAATRR